MNTKTWKPVLIVILVLTLISCEKPSGPELVKGENSTYPEEAGHGLYYPGENWEELCCKAAEAWDAGKLDAAQSYSESTDAAAVVIVYKGRIVRKWGEYNRKLECHSMRKSVMSAIYGNYVADGTIDLDATLEDLGIDEDLDPLTEEEKQATVRYLLQARSGVYHPANYETSSMMENRPERGSHTPGTHFWYNNWDFNALLTILEQATSRGFFDILKTDIADPIGMQNYRPETDGRYVVDEDKSIHPAYTIRMNAMDFARFGLLFTRKGKWEDTQVIPEAWVKESTTAYSDSGRGAYGYLWWIAADGEHFGGNSVAPDGVFSARGSGGQVLAVWPEKDLVVVQRVNTYNPDAGVSYRQFGELFTKILAAMPSE